jgi:hypothetical protein
MGVMFSTINPDDFGTTIKNPNLQFKRFSKKERLIAKQVFLEEKHKNTLGYLFTHKCSNKNCTETIDFIYEAVTSEKDAKYDAGWGYFKKIKGWLCFYCSEIQIIRNIYLYDKQAYRKAKAEYMNLYFPRAAHEDEYDDEYDTLARFRNA